MSCLGPLAGGAIEGLFGWRYVLALPMLGALLVPFLWCSLPTSGTGARLDIVGAVLVAGTAAGAVLLVQSPSSGPVVAVAGATLMLVGAPSVVLWVRRRPYGFLPMSVIRNAAVVRSALAAASVPAAWFALLIAVPAVLVGRRLGALAGRCRASAQRRHRAARAAAGRSATRADRAGPVLGHRHRGRVRRASPVSSRSRDRLGRHARGGRRGRDVRLRARPAGARLRRG